VRVVETGPCHDCGLDASTVHRAALGDALRVEGRAWAHVLRGVDGDALRRRPDATTWSALEYGAHVRDVLEIMTARTERTLVEDDPELAWWDHEAAAIEDGYNAQEPDDVADALAANADALAGALARVPDDGWSRTATRGDGNRFTIEGIARFTLHEARHHRHDATGS
jgi:hypothetical protein